MAATYLPGGTDVFPDRTMDSADDDVDGGAAALRAVGEALADCERVDEVARTATERIAAVLDADGVALCADGGYAAVAGTVPGSAPAAPEALPGTAAVAAGDVDDPQVGAVGEWGHLWIWRGEGPTPATTGALADRVGAAVARVRAERDRERVDERVETVASVVNHDLSNPLTIADGYLEVARTDADTDHLAAVAEALERIDHVADAVVTIARQGRRVEDVRPVPLDRVAEDAWRRQTGDGRLRADPATVRAEPDRLLTALEELFDNALRYADAPTITVRASADAVVVADDGPGMDPDERERALEAGYSTADGRSGLGLSVVEWLADAHGWSVSVRESEDGGLAVAFDGVAVTEPSG